MILFIYFVLFVIAAHWVCDFVLQTDWQAVNKSHSFKALFSHVLTYSIYMTVLMTWIYFPDTKEEALNLTKFFLVTLNCHFLTDMVTSRINKRLMPKRESILLVDHDGVERTYHTYPKGEKFHNFFVSIGFDQVLHYTQLFFTIYYLMLK